MFILFCSCSWVHCSENSEKTKRKTNILSDCTGTNIPDTKSPVPFADSWALSTLIVAGKTQCGRQRLFMTEVYVGSGCWKIHVSFFILDFVIFIIFQRFKGSRHFFIFFFFVRGSLLCFRTFPEVTLLARRRRRGAVMSFLKKCEGTERRAPALPGKVEKRCKLRIRPLRGAPKRKQAPFFFLDALLLWLFLRLVVLESSEVLPTTPDVEKARDE